MQYKHIPVSREALSAMRKTIIIYLTILLAAGFSINPCDADAATVYGPDDFTINFSHVHVSHKTFSVPVSGVGTMHVTKTTPDKKIWGGILWINGRSVMLDAFLQGGDNTYVKDIVVKTRSDLLVFLVGTPGAAISIMIDQAPTVPAPVVNLSVNPESIAPGGHATLEWDASNADIVTIDPDIGQVQAKGTVEVSPNVSTEYSLTAVGPGGTTTASATVAVAVPRPAITIEANPAMVAPGAVSVLSWRTEHAETCRIDPGIGDVLLNGTMNVSPLEDTLYTISASGGGGSSTKQVLVEVYPVRVKDISKSEATYLSPANTVAAGSSALRAKDIDWYYQSFTAETAEQDRQLFENAGIDPSEKFTLVENSTDYIVDEVDYKDGKILVMEKRFDDIDGSVVKGWVGFIQEDNIWKVTYKFSQDEELAQYNDVSYEHCIASYSFSPPDIVEDSSWHDNTLVNFGGTDLALDKRYDTDLTVAELLNENNGFFKGDVNGLSSSQLSMGGWVKAAPADLSATMIELGSDKVHATAIRIPDGKGLQYTTYIGNSLVETTVTVDYDFHDNQWHHLYMTYDGKEVKLYVDGKLLDKQAASGTIDSAPVLNIGQENSAGNPGGESPFIGRLDDIQLYNKALSAEEVRVKFENGTTESL